MSNRLFKNWINKKEQQTSNADNILVLGNLQAGKTLLFRRLCGERSTVIEIPDSSLSLTSGKLNDFTNLLDTPGTDTLFPQGEEEMVSRDAVLQMSPSAILMVADAKNLSRGLALTIQVAQFGIPMVLAVNMEDEAARYGISIDYGMLSSLLGIDVIPTVAVHNMGMVDLAKAIPNARIPRINDVISYKMNLSLVDIEKLLEGVTVSTRGLGILLLGQDEGAQALVEEQLGSEKLDQVNQLINPLARDQKIPLDVIITESLYAAAKKIADQVVTRKESRLRFLDFIGMWAHHPVGGLFIAVAVIIATYYWVGALGATLVVDTINTHLFEGWLIPFFDSVTTHIPSQIVREAIMDPDFGLLPTGVFLAFGLVMPVLFFFYVAFAVLIESGYLPRLSILLDRVFRKIGLNGSGILPLTMGFSCVTMALITTRMLKTSKERTIASLLLLLGTPCAPLLSMMMLVLADLHFSATIFVFGFILFQTAIAGYFSNKIMKGVTPDFILEIPPMRLPSPKFVMKQSLRQTYGFMKEAVPLFLLASISLFIFDRLGGLAALEKGVQPLMQGYLGLPQDAVQVFIKTLIRREAGAAELSHIASGFGNVQLVVTLLVMTFLTPCVNALIVLFKERGIKVASILVVSVSTYALLIGTVVNHVLRFLRITF